MEKLVRTNFAFLHFSRASFSALCWILLQISVAGQFLPVKTYTVADGLLSDSATCVKQDSRGYMWFCTAQGVSRFDGAAFTNFTVADGLPNRVVNDFLETKTGDYLFATDDGLAQLNPTGVRGSTDNPLFTVYNFRNSRAPSCYVLFEDEKGVV